MAFTYFCITTELFKGQVGELGAPVVLLIWQIAVSIFKLGNLPSEPLDFITEIIIGRTVFNLLRSGHLECLTD